MLKNITKITVATILIFSLQTESLADEFAKQQSVEDELNYLKNVVTKLEERVKRLEKEKTAKSPLFESATSIETKNATQQPKTSLDWRDKSSWNQIKEGMTAEQVEAVLGRPAKIEDTGRGFKKFLYHGDVIGSGSISGIVEMYENHVYVVHDPTF